MLNIKVIIIISKAGEINPIYCKNKPILSRPYYFFWGNIKTELEDYSNYVKNYTGVKKKLVYNKMLINYILLNH